MAVEREKGYEFRGWKLGEKVRLKRNGKEYTIVGFCEREETVWWIAIDFKEDAIQENVSTSNRATFFLKTDKDYFTWVTDDEIKKIEDTTLEKLKQYDYERAAEKQDQMKVSKNNEYKQCKHYSDTGIEPIQFIIANKYGFNQGNIVKYTHRVGKKAGQEVNDVKKIIDYAILLAYEKGIELEEGDLIELIKYRTQWIKEHKNDR